MNFKCPYLGAEVELSDERLRHILERHPELEDRLLELMLQTLQDPDEVRRSARSADAKLFCRCYSSEAGGKYFVAVVVSTVTAARSWVVTAYSARKLAGGVVEWKRS